MTENASLEKPWTDLLGDWRFYAIGALLALLWLGINAKQGSLLSPAQNWSIQNLRALGPLIALVVGLIVLVERRYLFPMGTVERRRVRPVPVVLLAFVGVIGLAVGLARSPSPSFSTGWGLAYLAVPVAFLAIWSLGRKDAPRIAYMLTLAVTALIAVVLFAFAILTFDVLSLGLDRVPGRPFVYGDYEPIAPAFLINANGVARFAAVAAIACLAIALCARSLWVRLVAVVPIALFGIMILATASRSGLVGLAVAMGAMLLLVLGWKRTAMVAAAAFLALAGLGVIQRIVHVLTREVGIQDFVLFTNRQWIWADGWQHIKTHPLLGWGFQTDRLLLGGEHLHHAWLQTALQTGFLGLLLFAVAWLLGLRSAVRLLGDRCRRWVPQKDRVLFVAAVGILVFFLLRSIPESTAAFYGVDLLILVPVFGYLWALESDVRAEVGVAVPDWSPTGNRAPSATGRKVLVCAFACRPPDSPGFNGGEDLLGWSLVSRLARHHHVHVLTSIENQYDLAGHDRITEHGSLTFHPVGMPVLDQKRQSDKGALQTYAYLWQARALVEAIRLHKEHRFDLFHHLTYANDWMATYIGAFLRVPYVRGPSGSGPEIPRPFLAGVSTRTRIWQWVRAKARHAFRLDPVYLLGQWRARRLLVCNPEAMDRLPPAVRQKAGLFPVVGVTDDELGQPPQRATSADAPLRIVSAGKLIPSKGFEWTIRAFATVQKSVPGTTLTIVGDGPDRPRLEGLARELGVADSVRFAGWVPSRREVLDHLRAGDVFLYPSLHDGGGAVVVEAMANGVPVVTLDVGGPAMHVDRSSGVKVPVRSPDQVVAHLAGALMLLHRHPAARTCMGNAARERVAARYRWEDLTTKVLEIYDEVLEPATGRGSAAPHPVEKTGPDTTPTP